MYLQLKQSQNNTICLTLKEKAIDSYPDIWLFRFVSEQSKKEYFCNLIDLSTSQGRYNLFHLYEGNDIDLPKGEYQYYVYQMEVIESEDYLNGILCELGKAKVISATATNIPTFTQTTTIKNVYE